MVTERFYAVIPCAGSGARFGGEVPKQYTALAGRPLVYYALAAFAGCAAIARTLVAVAPDDRVFETFFDADSHAALRLVTRRCGGASRHETVYNALCVLGAEGAADEDWVLVHDAARPGITSERIRQMMAAVREDPVGGILAMPLADTLKRAATGSAAPAVIAHTEPREGLWLAQTPQMFRLGALREALLLAQEAGIQVTDEASALEAAGLRVRLVPGDPANFKVTYPQDLELMRAVLAARTPGPEQA